MRPQRDAAQPHREFRFTSLGRDPNRVLLPMSTIDEPVGMQD